MSLSILPDENVDYLNNILLNDKKQFVIKSAYNYRNIPQHHLQLFGHHNAIYAFHTTELVEWIKDNFPTDNMIEIGAGNGALGRALGIPITDSKLQETFLIKQHYNAFKQPTIKYPYDVKKLNCDEAIIKYKPKIVIGSWITHKYDCHNHHCGGNIFGVNEDDLLNKVDTYIFIGNRLTHKNKPILSIPHREYSFEWLYSRGTKSEHNFIAVWSKYNG